MATTPIPRRTPRLRNRREIIIVLLYCVPGNGNERSRRLGRQADRGQDVGTQRPAHARSGRVIASPAGASRRRLEEQRRRTRLDRLPGRVSMAEREEGREQLCGTEQGR